MNLTTDRVARLRKALEHVTAHPEEWDQRRWITRFEGERGGWCGTAGCLAGTVVLQAGYRPAFENDQNTTHYVSDDRGKLFTIETVARQLLGVTNNQADTLFFPRNTLSHLWYVASELTNGEIEVPLELIDVDAERVVRDQLFEVEFRTWIGDSER